MKLKPEILKKLKDSTALRSKCAVARGVHVNTMDLWVLDETGRHAQKLTALAILKELAKELGYANPLELVEEDTEASRTTRDSAAQQEATTPVASVPPVPNNHAA